MDVAREVLVDRGEGVVEGVALVVRRFVDQSVHWVELGVAEGVTKEAGVARRGVGLNLLKDIMSKLSQKTKTIHVEKQNLVKKMGNLTLDPGI